MPRQTILFIDYENAYQNARELFHNGERDEEGTNGHFHPWQLGEEICRLHNEIRRPLEEPLALTAVRVYRGLPSSKDSRRYSAGRARKDAWSRRDGVKVESPPLAYDDLGNSREKEVDVKLAVDLVNFARDKRFDVGILFSADTDFRPALRYIRDDLRQEPRVDVAAWGVRSDRRFISLEGNPGLIVHWVPKGSYTVVADSAAYPPRKSGRSNNRRRRRRR